MAVKLLGVDSWVYVSWVKPAPVNLDSSQNRQGTQKPTYTCEPVEDLPWSKKAR